MLSLTKVTLIAIGFLAASQPGAAASEEELRSAARQVSQADAALVDVREADEIKPGIAAAAVWLPKSDFDASGPRRTSLLPALKAFKKVYIYCRSGARSGVVVAELRRQGYDAVNLGAFNDWKAAGLPVNPAPDAQNRKACPYLCELPRAGAH